MTTKTKTKTKTKTSKKQPLVVNSQTPQSPQTLPVQGVANYIASLQRQANELRTENGSHRAAIAKHETAIDKNITELDSLRVKLADAVRQLDKTVEL